MAVGLLMTFMAALGVVVYAASAKADDTDDAAAVACAAEYAPRGLLGAGRPSLGRQLGHHAGHRRGRLDASRPVRRLRCPCTRCARAAGIPIGSWRPSTGARSMSADEVLIAEMRAAAVLLEKFNDIYEGKS